MNVDGVANALRGEVAVQLGGETLVLVPRFDHLAALEAHLDIGLLDLAQRFQARQVGLRELAAICAFGAGEGAAAVDRRGAQLLQSGLAGQLLPLGQFLAAALTGELPGKPET